MFRLRRILWGIRFRGEEGTVFLWGRSALVMVMFGTFCFSRCRRMDMLGLVGISGVLERFMYGFTVMIGGVGCM